LKEALRLVGRLRPTAKISWSPVDNLHHYQVHRRMARTAPDEVKRTLASLPVHGAIDIKIKGQAGF
jgi:hypothetical protein